MILILLLIAAVQGLIVSVFVLFHRKFRHSPTRCLGWLTLVLSFDLLQPLTHIESGSIPYFLRYLNVPWFFFFIPFLFMFLERYTDEISRSKKYFFAAIVFFIVNVSLSVYWLVEELPLDILQSNLWKLRAVNETLGVLFSFFVWWKMRAYFRENKHFYPLGVQIWLRKSMVILFVVFSLWFIAVLSNYYLQHEHPFTFDPLYQLLRFSVALLVYWIFYVGIFKIILSRPYTRLSKSDNVDDGTYLQRIEEEEFFTDPYLNVDTLAEKLGISTAHLRLLIKSRHNRSFSEYINYLRVEKAKKLLSEPEYQHYTLQAVGEDAGFNSRSTFYRCFKKITGLTPKEFRERHSLGLH